MKLLRRISTAVLSCLVLAAPAAAASPEVSVTPPVFVGSTIVYHVGGMTSSYEIQLLHSSNARNSNANKNKEVILGHLSVEPETFEVQPLGSYRLCLYAKYYELSAETIFEVVALPICTEKGEVGTFPNCSVPTCQELSNCAPTIIPPVLVTIVTPAPLTVNVITKPVSKLTKALKQCKKLKPKSKRVKCERQARKKYEPKSKKGK
jgi:hypothetical protein